MSTAVARRHIRPNKLAVGLAAGASVVLGAAAVTGHELRPVEVGAALVVAGAIAVISVGGSQPQPQEPFALRPVRSAAAGPVVRAPRARSLLARPGQSDAA